jgi:hypothetical protein
MLVSLKRHLHLDPILLLILAVAALLLFFRLEQRPFWQDEAETAGLAKNVLTYGVPKAFDGFNLISQEEGREFGADYIWRWSPWLQIYVAAGAFRLGGLTTWAGRFPFALTGLAAIWLTYLLVKRRLGNLTWARLAAAILALSVIFLLFSRQCRYYSPAAFLALLSIYAFRGNWQSRVAPAVCLVLSLGLLFYANYLLFLSFAAAFLGAAILVYRQELPLTRTLILAGGVVLLIIPGLWLFEIQEQSGMLDLTLLGEGLTHFFSCLLMFLMPLPVVAVLVWRWRRLWVGREPLPADREERFIFFLGLIILINTVILSFNPQREHRYQIHLYPLAAILLGWVVCRVWRYHKFSGVLLALMLTLTNWLYLVPMGWLGIINRWPLNDVHMLSHANLPLRLYLTELFYPYPDVNQGLIQFFQTHAQAGDTILTTYGDLPLQFYTSFKVVGGQQRPVSPEGEGELPAWVVKRAYTRGNRDRLLNQSESLIIHYPRLSQEYQTIILPEPDDDFGNRADPFYHHFMAPSEPFIHLTVYHRKAKGDVNEVSP